MEQGVISMSKKALILIIAAVLALTALGVLAQDNGPGVINVTLPDGRSVPVFTDGRLNAFDIAAPVVVYYKATNGSIVNPNIAPGTQPDLNSLNFSNPNTLNTINTFMSNGNNANNAAGNSNNNAANSTNNNANSNASGNNNAGNSNNSASSSGNGNANSSGTNNGNTTTSASNQAGLINQLEVLAVGPGGSTSLVLSPTVEDLLSLVTGQQKSLSAQGYTVNFDATHNYFWVQAPADFEGKVYSFAWPNNIFPTNLIGQTGIRLTTSQLNSANANSNANANSTGNSNAQTTTQSGNQGSAQATAQPTSQGNGNGSGQATAQPTTQATSQPAQPTATP
jgi:hypothetical protein